LKKLAIFASGTGTNARKIIDHFRDDSEIRVALIVSNKPGAGVLQIATVENIPSLIIEKEKFFRGNGYADELKEQKIDLIVLAGFLWKIPAALIQAFPEHIINIHPALLPKYGGRGMFGHHVHDAVLASGDKETGITIHYVDEQYDHGKNIFQVTVPVVAGDDSSAISRKVQVLEHAYYPLVIDSLMRKPPLKN
jgi:formyltetrahydrofolate-dependent phosphoribosylglycinamide formyltransferase